MTDLQLTVLPSIVALGLSALVCFVAAGAVNNKSLRILALVVSGSEIIIMALLVIASGET